jgi:hypothetical protein
MKKTRYVKWLYGVLFGILVIAPAFAATPSKMGAAVYFISPSHGEVVSSPFKVRFGLVGMGVAPAGVNVSDTGHHHLLIDVPNPDLHDPVPKDDHHMHFGNGQTETELDLPPGKHTLQLLLADQNHVPHKPAVVSRQIIIYVQ